MVLLYTDSLYLTVFEKGEPSKATRKKGAVPQKRKSTDGSQINSNRAKKSTKGASKLKPEVVVINYTFDD